MNGQKPVRKTRGPSADGYLSSSDIDGDFGSQTKSATIALQSTFGLTADGGVGRQTFGWADQWLRYVAGSYDPGKTVELTYIGAVNNFTLYRNNDGNYEFYDGTGTKRAAGYDYRTCS